MSKAPPNPARFEKFLELPDKTGFTLPDGKCFYYDQFGGWYFFRFLYEY